MFQDFFQKRRWLARGGFFLFCVVPTVLVAAQIVYLRSSWYTHSWRRTLSDRCGFEVRIDRASRPRPGLVRFEGMEIGDPAGDMPIFASQIVEAAVQGDELLAVLREPTFQQSALRDVWRWLSSQMHASPAKKPWRVRLLAQEAHIVDRGAHRTFHDLDLVFDGTAEVARVDASCFANPNQPTERTRMRISGGSRTTGTELGLELFSPSPLPCSLGRGFFRVEDWLGSDSQFQGTLRVSQAATGVRGNVSGQLTDVDLSSLVTRRFGKHLDGQGEIRLHDVQFSEGHVHRADGTLWAGPGTVGRPLLSAAIGSLGMRGPARRPREVGEIYAYGQLAIRFALRQGELVLSGDCGPDPESGIVLVGHEGPLLFEPVGRQQTTGLIRMLADGATPEVPADPRITPLMALLPSEAPILPNVSLSQPTVGQGDVSAPRRLSR